MSGRRGTDGTLDGLLGARPDNRTMAAMVAERLRTAVLLGQLPPGTRLRLADVSERIGVSIMPVRDALRQLEAERFVDITPRRGAIVTPLSIDDAEEMYAIRVALETLAARHAVAQLTDDELAAIRDAFVGMVEAQRSDDLQAFIEADHLFHSRLYQASRRDRLIRSIAELVERSRRYSPYTYRSWAPLDARLEAHQRILDAIEARNGILVEQLTAEHMVTAAARLIAALHEEAQQLAKTPEPRRPSAVSRIATEQSTERPGRSRGTTRGRAAPVQRRTQLGDSE